jgi:hypothetical protein
LGTLLFPGIIKEAGDWQGARNLAKKQPSGVSFNEKYKDEGFSVKPVNVLKTVPEAANGGI